MVAEFDRGERCPIRGAWRLRCAAVRQDSACRYRMKRCTGKNPDCGKSFLAERAGACQAADA
jgi:hypothetical protein